MKKKILVALSVLIASMCFVSCNKKTRVTTLDTPTNLVIENQYISFDEVANASYYIINYHQYYLWMKLFGNLSSQYIEPFKDLVNALVEKYNFIFVLVAHDPRFISIADYKYEIKDGNLV